MALVMRIMMLLATLAMAAVAVDPPTPCTTCKAKASDWCTKHSFCFGYDPETICTKLQFCPDKPSPPPAVSLSGQKFLAASPTTTATSAAGAATTDAACTLWPWQGKGCISVQLVAPAGFQFASWSIPSPYGGGLNNGMDVSFGNGGTSFFGKITDPFDNGAWNLNVSKGEDLEKQCVFTVQEGYKDAPYIQLLRQAGGVTCKFEKKAVPAGSSLGSKPVFAWTVELAETGSAATDCGIPDPQKQFRQGCTNPQTAAETNSIITV